MRIIISTLLVAFFFTANAQVNKVTCEKVGDKWTLLRNGEPYYIKGVGGQTELDKAVEIGANSIRTWGLDQLNDGLLDRAHEKGLTVMLGLWVGQERQGFDYDDPVAVRKQLERFRTAVLKYKDHPALLLWGVGNEVDLFYTNTKVWDAMQDIAAMIHELDPNHPTSTVTAGLRTEVVKQIKEKVPDIDIYAVNTYSALESTVRDMRVEAKWDGPYIIGEYGVDGHWESPKTNFGVPVEQTSHEKAKSFDMRYRVLEADSNYCIGSYAFLWGAKQETTSTWYGLFTPDGESSEAVDALQRRWGTEPENRAPVLKTIQIEGKSALDNIYITAGDLAEVTIDVSDPDNDKMKFEWSVISESTDVKAGGDKEKAPPTIPGTIKSNKGDRAIIRAPKKEGQYRVFVFARDGNGQAGTANIPFYVLPRPEAAGQARTVEFKNVELDIPER